MLDTSAPLASSLRARGGGPSAQGARQSGTALRRRRGGHPRRPGSQRGGGETRGQPPEPLPVDGPLRGRGHRGPGGAVASAQDGAPPYGGGARSPGAGAAPATPALRPDQPAPSAGQRGGGPGSLAYGDLPGPSPSRPHRGEGPAQAPTHLQALGTGPAHGAVADGRGGRGPPR